MYHFGWLVVFFVGWFLVGLKEMTSQSPKNQRRHWWLICFCNSKCLDQFRHWNNLLALLDRQRDTFCVGGPSNTLLVCRSSSLLMLSRGRYSPLDDPAPLHPVELWKNVFRLWGWDAGLDGSLFVSSSLQTDQAAGGFSLWVVVRKNRWKTGRTAQQQI